MNYVLRLQSIRTKPEHFFLDMNDDGELTRIQFQNLLSDYISYVRRVRNRELDACPFYTLDLDTDPESTVLMGWIVSPGTNFSLAEVMPDGVDFEQFLLHSLKIKAKIAKVYAGTSDGRKWTRHYLRKQAKVRTSARQATAAFTSALKVGAANTWGWCNGAKLVLKSVGKKKQTMFQFDNDEVYDDDADFDFDDPTGKHRGGINF